MTMLSRACVSFYYYCIETMFVSRKSVTLNLGLGVVEGH